MFRPIPRDLSNRHGHPPLPVVTPTTVAFVPQNYFVENYFVENLAVRADESVLITVIAQQRLGGFHLQRPGRWLNPSWCTASITHSSARRAPHGDAAP